MENTNLKKRPDILTLLCVLTFIGSGLSAFSNFFFFIAFDEILPMLDEFKENLAGIEVIFTGGPRFFLAGFILYFISLAGALMMWRLRKIGFHLYTASQVFLLVLPVVMLQNYQFSLVGLLITVVFVMGYFSQMKFMD